MLTPERVSSVQKRNPYRCSYIVGFPPNGGCGHSQLPAPQRALFQTLPTAEAARPTEWGWHLAYARALCPADICPVVRTAKLAVGGDTAHSMCRRSTAPPDRIPGAWPRARTTVGSSLLWIRLRWMDAESQPASRVMHGIALSRPSRSLPAGRNGRRWIVSGARTPSHRSVAAKECRSWIPPPPQQLGPAWGEKLL